MVLASNDVPSSACVQYDRRMLRPRSILRASVAGSVLYVPSFVVARRTNRSCQQGARCGGLRRRRSASSQEGATSSSSSGRSIGRASGRQRRRASPKALQGRRLPASRRDRQLIPQAVAVAVAGEGLERGPSGDGVDAGPPRLLMKGRHMNAYRAPRSSRARPAWDRTPEDLRELGYRRDPKHLFGRLQRGGPLRERGHGPLSPDLVVSASCVDGVLGHCSLPRSLPRRVPRPDGATQWPRASLTARGSRSGALPRAASAPKNDDVLSVEPGRLRDELHLRATGAHGARGTRREWSRSFGQLWRAHAIASGPRSAESLNVVFMGTGEPPRTSRRSSACASVS